MTRPNQPRREALGPTPDAEWARGRIAARAASPLYPATTNTLSEDGLPLFDLVRSPTLF